jgi:hypothetical protein
MAGGDGKDKKPEVVTEYKFAQGRYTNAAITINDSR